jgi:hypothetical protein
LDQELSSMVNFLDLTLSIQGHKIISRTYQKEMKLYLYIPPASAHPAGWCYNYTILKDLKSHWQGHLPYTRVYKCHQMFVSHLFWLFLSNPLSHRTDFLAKPIIPKSSWRDESNGVQFTMGAHRCLLETY